MHQERGQWLLPGSRVRRKGLRGALSLHPHPCTGHSAGHFLGICSLPSQNFDHLQDSWVMGLGWQSQEEGFYAPEQVSGLHHPLLPPHLLESHSHPNREPAVWGHCLGPAQGPPWRNWKALPLSHAIRHWLPIPAPPIICRTGRAPNPKSEKRCDGGFTVLEGKQWQV